MQPPPGICEAIAAHLARNDPESGGGLFVRPAGVGGPDPWDEGALRVVDVEILGQADAPGSLYLRILDQDARSPGLLVERRFIAIPSGGQWNLCPSGRDVTDLA